MYDLLAGLTVIEGAAFIAGPSSGLYLAQMGATVIRFDQIGGGPDSHRWPVAAGGESLYWEGLNKAKRSIAIDLARPAGRELAQRLATAGDGLFVTNFPERGFLSYDRLKPLRPDLICLRIMGWADGTPAVDYTINAAVRVPMMTGPIDDLRPVNHVLPAWDLLAGAYAAFALLAAHHARAKDGAGREIRLASAATFNGHRIHYDRPYATEIEHYPGLVVHGPFIAAKLAALAARVGHLASFAFQAHAPCFVNHPVRLGMTGSMTWAAVRNDDIIAMTAKATYR